ncbi:MAG TPA: PilZ domain-containing protein [Gemmataceae bacterium]|nr:PilZ domain-containing protein [Gemmataceae bacterium]
MPDRIVPSSLKSKKRSPGAEGRAWVRYPCDSAISFQPLESRKDGNWRPAKIVNISAKGLGLRLETPVQRGAILCVLLEATANRFSQPLLVRVVRVGERGPNGWQVGCTFAIPLGEEELRALLPGGKCLESTSKSSPQPPAASDRGAPSETHDPFLQGSVNERRLFPRRKVSVPITISYGTAGEKMHEAAAIDTSLGGLKLLTRHPFGRGTILRVRSTRTPARVPSVEVRVKSCTPQQSKWLVATQFLHQPPSEILFYFS